MKYYLQKLLLLTAIIIITSLSTVKAQCDYKVNLFGSYAGYSWDWFDNSITISVNGSSVLTDIDANTSTEYSFQANPGDLVEVAFNETGYWGHYCEYVIADDANNYPVFIDGSTGETPAGGSFTVGDCASSPWSDFIQDILIGTGAAVSNVTFTGNASQIAEFNEPGRSIGIDAGIVMSTGKVSKAFLTSNMSGNHNYSGSGDADLDAITVTATHDAAILEFDFVLQADSMAFRYVFGSEEYPGYVGAQFNDAFAFLLTGPNPDGGNYSNENIALIPNTNVPVAINNVNNEPGWNTYSQYYNDNSDVLYDGHTTVLTAGASLTQGETYHMKLVVADVSDGLFDSGVFLEAQSFTIIADQDSVVLHHYNNWEENDSIQEGCPNQLVFTRYDELLTNNDITINLSVSGTATEGTDYNSFPATIDIPAGQISSTTFDYIALFDDIAENENIIISYSVGDDTYPDTTIYILDNYSFGATIDPTSATYCSGDPAISITVSVNPLLDADSVLYSWDYNDVITNQISVTPDTTTTYTVTLTASCQSDTTLTSTINVGTTDASFTVDSIACIGEAATVTYTGTSGTDATYTWSFDGGIPATATGQGPHSVSWSTSGEKIVTLNLNDCGTDTHQDTININDVPTTEFSVGTISCPGSGLDITYTGTATSGTYYWDFDGATIISGSDSGPYSVTWLTSGDYTVILDSIISDANGCNSVAPDSIIINVPDPVRLLADTIGAKCFGSCDGEVQLTSNSSNSPFTYAWSGEATGSGDNDNITGLCPGTYNITITDAGQCVGDTTFTISEPDEIVATTTRTDISCFGFSDGTASVAATGGTPGYSYSWPNGNISDACNNLSAGNHTVTVTDGNNCTDTVIITIIQPQELRVETQGIVFACINENVSLTISTTGGTPDYQHLWSNNCVTQTNDVLITQDADFTITVTDDNGCTATDNVSVDMYPVVELVAIVSDTIICPGESITINAYPSGGTGAPYSVGLDNQLTNFPATIYPEDGQEITISVEDVCLTSKEVAFTIHHYDIPDVNLISDIRDGCQPLSVEFSLLYLSDISEYSWRFGDNNFSNNDYPTNVYEDFGEFDVEVTLETLDGCKTTEVFENYINVYPNPTANFVADQEISTILTPDIYFNNYSLFADNCIWSFGDGYGSDEYSPKHEYTTVDEFVVTLEVVTDKGCKDTTTNKVVINDIFTLYAPTAFTPGNSDSENRVFYVTGNGISSEQYSLIIFDRWGEKVFETNKYNEEEPATTGWNGRMKYNKYVPNGVYKWYVSYLDGKGQPRTSSGDVTVIR